jgi:hypothetical protein
VYDANTVIGNNEQHDIYSLRNGGFDWQQCAGKTTIVSVGGAGFGHVYGVNSSQEIYQHRSAIGGVYNVFVGGGTQEGETMLSCNGNGSTVDLYHSDDDSGRQQWHFQQLKDASGHFTISILRGVSDGNYLLSAYEDGTLHVHSHDDGSSRQHWKLVYVGDGMFNIHVAGGNHPGKEFLSCRGDGFIDLWVCDDDSGRQKWRLNKIAPSPFVEPAPQPVCEPVVAPTPELVVEPVVVPAPKVYDEEYKMNKLREFCATYEVKTSSIHKLRSLEEFEIICVCDDSGSMSAQINDEECSADPFAPRTTRWTEMQRTIGLIVDFASCLDQNGVDVYFLNRSPVLGVHDAAQLQPAFATPPAGYTPVVASLNQALNSKQSALQERKVLLIIATDGAPTDTEGGSDLPAFVNF